MLRKKLLSVSVAFATLATIGMCSQAHAAAPGFYLGGQVGWGDVHQSGISASDLANDFYLPFASFSSSSKDTGIAGRAFVGYQFNPYFATEFGYTQFSNMTTRASGVSVTTPTFAPFTVIGINASGKVKTHAFDLVGKGILPLSNGFSLYAKAGAALITSQASESETLTIMGLPGTIASASQTTNKIYPTFGAGVSYDITSHLVTDLSYNRIQKVGSSDAVASTDFVGLGLAYHFG